MFHACDRSETVAAIREALEDPTLPDGSRYRVTQLGGLCGSGVRDGLVVSLCAAHADIREAAALALELGDEQRAR